MRFSPYIILYLTLDGHEPNNDSTFGNTFSMQNDKDFYCIDYKSFIREWLNQCKEKAVSYPIVRETITQYYNLILKLTNQNMENSTKEELIELLANRDNIAAMFKIRSVHYDVLNKICNTTLIGQVQEIAKELDMVCTCSTTNWCKRWSGHFFFSKPEWKHFCIGFEFMGDELKDFNFGVRYVSESEKDKSPEVKQEISEKLKGTSNSWWASFKPFEYQSWNNDVVFERLYDGTIKTEIMKNVIDLCKDLEGIDL